MGADDRDDYDDEGKLDSLFGAVHAESHQAIAQAAKKVHPSRARAARAGIPIGRMVRADDFEHKKAMRDNGVPGLIGSPRQPEQGDQPPVQQYRQMTGLAPNSRSNTYLFIPSEHPDNSATPATESVALVVPFFQFNGVVDDTDELIVTLGITLSKPTTDTNPDNFQVKALVKWGVGNSSFQAIIDWKRGTSFCLPANYLSVTALIPSTRIANTPPYTLSAGVAYGVAPTHLSRATFTVLSDILLANQGSSQTINIPDFANSFGVGAAGFQPTFVGPYLAVAAGTGNMSEAFQAGPGGLQAAPMTFPIPNGTTTITLSNLDPNVNSQAVVIFAMPF